MKLTSNGLHALIHDLDVDSEVFAGEIGIPFYKVLQALHNNSSVPSDINHRIIQRFRLTNKEIAKLNQQHDKYW